MEGEEIMLNRTLGWGKAMKLKSVVWHLGLRPYLLHDRYPLPFTMMHMYCMAYIQVNVASFQ